MKAILVIDIPNDYQKYGSGKWYIKGDLLRIGYKEKDGSFVGKKQIENEMVQLKPMPEKELIWNDSDDYQIGWNDCIDEILGEKYDKK